MSTLAVDPGSVASSDAAVAVRGRVHVRERVIEKVVREAAAGLIGVPRDEVQVAVSEWGGGLAVRVMTKLPIPDLDDVDAIRAAPPVLERVRQTQSALADEFARLTGREIRRVSVIVTGALIPTRKRVR